MRKTSLLAAFLLFLAIPAFGQTPVALLPPSHQQFFLPSGAPNAGGCLFFYQSGTSTPLGTYTDVGGLTLQSNPVILDSSGYATIYLQNAEYRVTMFSTGGVNCVSGSQIWSQDGVSAYQILNSTNNIVFASVTSDPTGQQGELGPFRSDLGCLRLFFVSWDCITTNQSAATLQNKILTAPTITNPTITGGGSWSGSPSLATPVIAGVDAQSGVSYTFAATDEQKLVTFNNAAPVAATLPQATTAGFGSGTVFHVRNLGVGTVTVTPTTSTIDGAATLVLLTGQGADIYSDGANYQTQKGIGPVTTGAFTGCTNFTPVTVTNNNAQQNLMACTVPANTLAQGSQLTVYAQGIESTSTGMNTLLSISFGGGTACVMNPSQTIANNQPWNAIATLFILTTGVGGTANWSCQYNSSISGGFAGPNGVIGTPTISINTTISNSLLVTEQMSVANAGNSFTQQGLKSVVF